MIEDTTTITWDFDIEPPDTHRFLGLLWDIDNSFFQIHEMFWNKGGYCYYYYEHICRLSDDDTRQLIAWSDFPDIIKELML